MPSRKKMFVLLRGVLSGKLIVGSRAWYERERVAKGRLWKLMHQSNDETVLFQMAKLGNEPEPKPDDIDKWFDTKRR
jgi:hypothetical protein